MPRTPRRNARHMNKLVEDPARNGSCRSTDNAGYCTHPETQRNVRRCQHAIRANKSNEPPAVICELEL